MKSSASDPYCIHRMVSPNCHPDRGKVTSNDQPVFNTQLLIDPQGGINGRYEKLHLFDVVRLPASSGKPCLKDLTNHPRKDIKGGTRILESNTTKPGRKLVPPVNTPIGKGIPVPSMNISQQLTWVMHLVGMLTCYDLRFPEASLLLRKQGAQILTYPSAFTMRTGEAHWGARFLPHVPLVITHTSPVCSIETLLRARAIETQCYVLAPAQVGEHFPGSGPTPDSQKPTIPRTSYGKAMIVDPWGTVLAKCIDDPTGQHEAGAFCIAEYDSLLEPKPSCNFEG